MRSSTLDRDTLARRNQRLAQALHQPSPKHHLRKQILRLVARAPLKLQSADSNRLLIIRPDHLGDMLLTTPAIRLIKEQRPELSIHVLCGDGCADAIANFDEVDQVLTLPFPGFQRGAATGDNPYWLALQSARKLRQVGYDSAIIMRPDHWWGALLAFLAGIRQRIGYDQPGLSPFLTIARTLKRQHAIEQNLVLAQALAGRSKPDDIQLKFPLRAHDRDAIDKRLADWGIRDEAPIICIHPGAGASSKIWRAEGWAAVADAITQEFEAAIIFTGTSGEQAAIKDIAAKMKTEASVSAGSTSLGQLAALYRRALLVIGPDSGALHLAAAVHSPTVALFGPADPIEFAPWGDPRRHAIVTSDIACRPCRILDWRGDNPDYHPCVRDITVEQILAATRRGLNAG